MIIAIDIRSLSGGAHTGVGEYTSSLLRAMIGIDKSIRFKLFFNARSNKPNLDFLEGATNIEPYFFGYPNKYFSFTTRFFNTPKIDTLIGGADIFFSPHFISAPTSSKCKNIVTFHDISFERYPEFFDTARKVWHFSNNPRRQAEKADHIIAMSESTAYDLSDIYGVNPAKISVIYSGISGRFSRDQTREELWHVKAKYNLPENFIFSLSTIEPRKNVLGIIRAFEEFKDNASKSRDYSGIKSSNARIVPASTADVKLVIAGKPGWLYRDVFQAIKNSRYRNEIKYIGFIDDNDKPSMYRLARLFVYPSIYEGFGFPPLEAMASGTPVITSACSSLPEVVEDAAILVDPFNISDIAWMMEEVLRDNKLSNFLSIKGRAQAKKFTWEKCAQETLKILAL